MADSTKLARIDRSPLANRVPLTPTDVVRAFFARRSSKTVEAYRGDLRLLAKWLGQSDDLNALASWLFEQGPGYLNAQLMQWVEEQTREGRAPFTVNRRLSAVRSFIKMGRTLGVINWSLDVQGVRGAQGVLDMRGPVPPDVRKLFTAAATLGAKQLAVISLLYMRGLRSIEVRELQMKHLLLDRNEVLVRGKGKSGLAPVTLDDGTVQALRSWILQRGTEPGFVFSSSRYADRIISHMVLWRLVKTVGKRAEVQVRPHGLRHSAITAVLDANGGDIRRTQKFSRHKNPTVLLQHYDDARTDFGGEAARGLRAQLEES